MHCIALYYIKTLYPQVCFLGANTNICVLNKFAVIKENLKREGSSSRVQRRLSRWADISMYVQSYTENREGEVSAA